MADDDVEVVLKDDEEIKAGETPKTAEPAPAEDGVTKGVDELLRDIEAEKARTAAAEQRAAAAEQRAGQAETSAAGSQMAVIQGALDTIKSNRDILTKQASAAMAEGDFDKAAEIQAQIAEQAAVKLDLEKGKAALEARSKATPRNDDPVEQYISTLGPNSERAASWLRAHPDYVTDAAKNKQLIRMHHHALGEGHAQGTAEYFGYIEGKLGMRGNGHAQERREELGRPPEPPAREEPTSAAAQVVSRRDDVQPSPAPTSRGSGSSRRITLTKAEQEAADISGVSYEEYARSRERERKAGTLIYTHNQRRH